MRPRRCSGRFRLRGTVLRTPITDGVPLRVGERKLSQKPGHEHRDRRLSTRRPPLSAAPRPGGDAWPPLRSSGGGAGVRGRCREAGRLTHVRTTCCGGALAGLGDSCCSPLERPAVRQPEHGYALLVFPSSPRASGRGTTTARRSILPWSRAKSDSVVSARDAEPDAAENRRPVRLRGVPSHSSPRAYAWTTRSTTQATTSIVSRMDAARNSHTSRKSCPRLRR